MDYEEHIKYHKEGDANVEERLIHKLAKHLNLSRWDSLLFHYIQHTKCVGLIGKPKQTKGAIKIQNRQNVGKAGKSFSVAY